MAIEDPKRLSEINRLIDEYNQKIQAGIALNKEQLDQYDRLIQKREQLKQRSDATIQSHQKEIELLEEYLTKLSTVGNTIDGNLLKRQVMIDKMEEELSLLQEEIKAQEQITQNDLDRVKEIEDLIEAQKTVLSVEEDMNKEMRQTTSLVQAAEKAAAKMALTLKTPALALGQLNMGLQKLGGFLTTKFIDGFAGMITKFDEATKAFETQFAVGDQYKTLIKELYDDQVMLGVGMDEITKATGEMITNFTDFTMLLPEQQKQLARTATILQESYGMATADTSKIVQTSTKMLGMGVAEASNYASELAATAEALGVAPGELSSKFAQMGPQLAKFGLEGGKAFKELARIQKLTGMEMEKVLAITNKFDTFEGAAEQAGQLNAALGGNFVNAMDLMMATDPVERFDMIRDAIMDTGLTFDSMSYYQKQFYTNALGLSDVGDLALMMSGNMDALGGATQKTAKEYELQAQRAKDLLTIQETLQTIFLQNSETVEDFANALAGAARFLADNGKAIFYFVAGMQLLNLAMAVYKGFKMFAAAMAPAETAAKIKELAQIKSITGALRVQLQVQRQLNKEKNKGGGGGGAPGGGKGVASAFGTAATIAAVGLALVGFGLAIKLASSGVAEMANSLKGLNPEQLSTLESLFSTLALTLIGFSAGIVILGLAGVKAAPGILAVGAAVALVGAGIGLAAAGVGFMLSQFTKLGNLDYTSLASGISKLAPAVAKLGIAALLLGNPISLAGLGALAALGAAGKVLGAFIGMFSKEKDGMQDMAVVMEKFGAVTVAQLEKADETFANIKDSINATNKIELLAYSALMPKMQVPTVNQTPAPAIASAAAAQATKPQEAARLTLNFNIDGETLDSRIVSVSKTADGWDAVQELLGFK